MIVQGFGNVGSNTAVILSKLGVSTIAVGDHTGYMYNPEGFNAHKLQDYVEEARQHRRLPGRQADHARRVLRDEGGHLRPVRAREPGRRGGGQGARREARRRRRQRPVQPRGRAASCSTAASTSCPTCSPTPAASPSATTSGCRTSARETWTEEEVDARLEVAMKRAYREVSEFARAEEVRPAPRRLRARAPAHRGRLQGARDLPVASGTTERRGRPRGQSPRLRPSTIRRCRRG